MLDLRLKILRINKFDLVDILLNKKQLDVELPDDIKIEGYNYNHSNLCFELILSSMQFPVIFRGDTLPYIENNSLIEQQEVEDAIQK